MTCDRSTRRDAVASIIAENGVERPNAQEMADHIIAKLDELHVHDDRFAITFDDETESDDGS